MSTEEASETLDNINQKHDNTCFSKHIYLGGFKYTLNGSTSKTLYYACSSRRTKKNGGLCKARVNIDKETGDAKQSGDHECSKVIQSSIAHTLLNIEKEVR
jgi:hypothetical protein